MDVVVRDYFPFNFWDHFWEHPSQSGHQDSRIQVFTFMFYGILLDVLLNIFKLSTLDIISNPGFNFSFSIRSFSYYFIYCYPCNTRALFYMNVLTISIQFIITTHYTVQLITV